MEPGIAQRTNTEQGMEATQQGKQAEVRTQGREKTQKKKKDKKGSLN